MIRIEKKQNCSGCGACATICPKNCIQMVPDEEGFLYPKVDEENCINCERCVSVCPVLNKKGIINSTIAYAVINNDENIRMQSSSGGVFTLISKLVLKQEGVVFGAAFDKDFELRHISVDNLEDLYKLRGSKYLQSQVGDAYERVKDCLEQGRLVYFTGTPCQVEGLRSFLGRDYENLITSDVVCHGVPSPNVWRFYLENQQKKACSKITEVSFRDKKCGWGRFSVRVRFSNNTEYIQIHSKDLYMKSFLSNLCLRPSCYSCSFKSINRCSDFTLADFWGIENVAPEMNDEKGTSLLLVNTDKGAQIFEQLKSEITFKQIELEQAIKHNLSAIRSVDKPKNRDKFMRRISAESFDKIVYKFSKPSIFNRLKLKVYSMLFK